MKVEMTPGKYVVAVSGGVDSVVLLDVLASLSGVELVVAHFDHGMRRESGEDRQFVQELAAKYNLPFVYREGKLGADASEATARQARYDFLRRVQKDSGARAIVTAHHQDDVLETAIINLLRGTGRKGLSSLQSTAEIQRPLLAVPKKTIIAYAYEHHLHWHDDATNADIKYLRNYIRHRILPKFDDATRAKLLEIIAQAHTLNLEIDALLAEVEQSQEPNQLARAWLIALPHTVSREVFAMWLRRHGATFDKKTLERLVVAAKTYAPGKLTDVDAQYIMKVERKALALARRDR